MFPISEKQGSAVRFCLWPLITMQYKSITLIDFKFTDAGINLPGDFWRFTEHELRHCYLIL